jgi:hypothetical protein
MMDVKSLIASHRSHSMAFRSLFDAGKVKSNLELIALLSREYEDFPDSAAITIVNWNRGTRPERSEIGLNDQRLDEILSAKWPAKA